MKLILAKKMCKLNRKRQQTNKKQLQNTSLSWIVIMKLIYYIKTLKNKMQKRKDVYLVW